MNFNFKIVNYTYVFLAKWIHFHHLYHYKRFINFRGDLEVILVKKKG